MLTSKPLWVLFALSLSLSAFAQNKKISGKVSSADKTPLAGVTVQVKNSNVFTTTAEDGSFSLTAPVAEKAVLVFSSIGFEKKELEITGDTPVIVELITEAKDIADVVVVGYGSQRKTDLTGSVSSLRGEKIKDLPLVSIEQAMQGRMAGVQVQQTSGQPGGGISIRVRGVFNSRRQ